MKSIVRIAPPIITDFAKGIYRFEETDEYIQWLCHILGGWVTPDHGNLRAFDYALRHMPMEGAVVEIGSFLGLSTNIITYLMAKYDRDNPFFTCDPWDFEETDEPIGGYFDASTKAYREYATRVFAMNTSLFSKGREPYAIEIHSSHFFELWCPAQEQRMYLVVLLFWVAQ